MDGIKELVMKEVSPELNGIEVMHPELGNIKVIIIKVFKEKMEFMEKPLPELDGIEKMHPELGSIKEGTGTLSSDPNSIKDIRFVPCNLKEVKVAPSFGVSFTP